MMVTQIYVVTKEFEGGLITEWDGYDTHHESKRKFSVGDIIVPAFREHRQDYWWHLRSTEYGGTTLPDPGDMLRLTDREVRENFAKYGAPDLGKGGS